MESPANAARESEAIQSSQEQQPRLITRHPILQPDHRRIRLLNQATRYDQAMMSAGSIRRQYLLRLRRQLLPYYFTLPPLWRVLLRHLISKSRVVPDFASLGAVRSGTTQLADYIMQHPCVVLPLAKEIGATIAFSKLIKAQFPTRRQMLAVERKYGMAITGYCAPIMPSLSFPYFANAIAPNVKIIIIVRNPVDRAFAHWRWDQVLLRPVKTDPLWNTWPSFDEIVRIEIESFQDGGHPAFSLSGAGCGYVRNSIYLPFLKLLRRFYPPENILIINANDFFAEPATTAKHVYTFLKLPPYEPVVLPVRNSAPPEKMEDTTRDRLSKFFAPHNQELYRFVGRDFGWE